MSGFECEFAFQHEYGRRWILYLDNEIEIMNKALKRGQKTVTLPSNNPKKRIVVNFVSMLQKNKISNIEQRVRCLLFTKEFNAWMWLDDADEYSSFRPFQVYFLEAAFQQKLKEIKFYNSGDYTVDLKNFREIDEETNDYWAVRRETVYLDTSPVIDQITAQSRLLSSQMSENEDLRSLCKERIFDTSIYSMGTANNSSRLDIASNTSTSLSTSLSSSFLSNSEEISTTEFFNTSVDKECPDAGTFRVYSAGELYYGATLTCTSLESNINKYLIMQILVDNDGRHFLWQRWGRIGYKAQTKLSKYGAKLKEAKTIFEEKFYEKTKNNWQDVCNFMHIPGKYDLLQMDLSPEVAESNNEVESRLPSQIQDLLALITSRKMMSLMMADMSYDLKRAPLGKLTISQIKEGYSALNRISEVMSRGGKGKDLINACNEFYTKIPHNFGRNKPKIIKTEEDIEEKLKMLEALLNINIAVDIFNEISSVAEHPLDKYYKSLDNDLKHIDSDSLEFLVIKNALLETHAHTHTDYQMSIVDIFACDRISERNSFIDLGNKFLLWHGSRLTNWIGILKKGLRIAPMEAPSTGDMFGKGLYFADASSKSANYCFPTKRQNMGLLLLSEVSLGKSLDLFHSVENMPHFLPPGYESVRGRGKFVPFKFQTGILACEAKLPVGPLIEDSEVMSDLTYNEYVVYNTKQVRMKYVVLVKFDFN